MTIYKSHQVNLDPEPWACHSIVTRDGGKSFERAEVRRHAEEHEGDVHFEPRPEFEPTRDPRPWSCPDFPSLPHFKREPLCPRSEWAPRREQFDTPVNRVLVKFRAYNEANPASTQSSAIIWVGFIRDNATTDFTPDEIDHARRVLKRLAGWSV